ncbi:MAG: D-2-hydroxyacid dehydrogenase [Lachnospiraceae bacterium]|nr:D-2-hydroxyacid dehydrogenase [Lachnospiraceae bacterium]
MKVIVLGGFLEQKHKDLINKTAKEAGAEVLFTESEDTIPEEYKDAEVLYGFGVKTAATSRSLKWLCFTSAGVESMLKPGAFANEDCILTNSSGSYGVSIAEHIIAVSLMMMRKMTYNYALALKGEWGERLPQRSLIGSRITVLGTGDIGSSFAKRAAAFEPASITGVCRSGKCDEPYYDKVLKVDELDSVLPETDLLVMSLPDTVETRGILSRERLALLPHDAFIVNVGRGSAIDEDALVEALEADRLAGAALDVFRQEPIPAGSRLWTTRNLLITPHVAGNLTIGYTVDRNVEMFCEDLLNYAAGRPLKYLVDKKKGY